MVGSVPVRIIPFVLLVTCGSLCQQRLDNHTSNTLPDAPSTEISRNVRDDTRSSLTLAPVGSGAELTADSERASISDARTNFGALAWEPVQKDSGNFFEKYLYLTLFKRNPSYHPSAGGGFMSRATYAATTTFVTRDDLGRYRLNTSYFVGVLSSAVIHSAHRPYWRRSVSDPFSDFGSNIGNDAGMNLVHEFGPSIQQLMRGHAPKFVSKIEAHLSHK